MTDQFPGLLKVAAEEFSNQCTGFAQFRIEKDSSNKDVFKARLQAVEIMKQFVGDVTFGQDPKGVLFYKHVFDFEVSRVEFDYQRFSGPSNLVTIRVNFRDEGTTKVFARFLARFDIQKYPIPLYATAGGNGRWTKYIVATSQVDAIRQQDSTRLYLQLSPLYKEVYFETSKRSLLKTTGTLIFPNLHKLKNQPNIDENSKDTRRMLADYAPDRIVFHVKKEYPTEKNTEFGLFLPADPLQDIGITTVPNPDTTWREFEPDTRSFASAEEEEAEA